MKHLRVPLLSGLISLLLHMPASAGPGDLDTTFGASTGTVVTDLGGYEHGNSVAVLSDGKILVAGDSSGDFLVARYNDDGTLDTTFNAAGATPGVATTDLQGSFDQAYAIAVQSDGKIVVVGTTDNGGAADFGVVRYNSDGTIDTDFGVDGIVVTDLGQDGEEAKGVAVQADGKIIVVGYTSDFTVGPDSEKFATVRYTAAGALDTSFSGDGKDLQDLVVDLSDIASCVAIQSNQKIVVGGVADGHFAVIRYTTSGVLDTTFSGDGKVTGPFGFTEAVLLQDDPSSLDDKILLGGYGYAPFSPDQDAILVRYTAAGVLDGTLAGGGMVVVDVGSSADKASALAIEPSGKIVFAGQSADPSDPSTGKFLVGRLNTNGTLDQTFGPNGLVSTDVAGLTKENAALGMGLKDGKILLAGYSDNGTDFDISLARYQGGEPPPAPEIAVYQGISTSLEEEVQSGNTIRIPGARVGLTTKTATITISNIGNLPLTGLSASLVGGSEFTLTQPVAASLNPGQSTTLMVRCTPTAGGLRTDTLEIQSNDADESPFILEVSVIVPTTPSDTFAGRVNLGGAGSVDIASNNLASSMEAGEPNPGNLSGASVWYEWTPTTTGWYTIHTVGSSFDTVLGLFTGSNVNALSQLGYSDDSFDGDDYTNGGNPSRLIFHATSGTSYKIGVFGYTSDASSDRGDFELHIAPVDLPVRVTGITSATVDVSSDEATSSPLQISIESDDPLTTFTGNIQSFRTNGEDYSIPSDPLNEASLVSGTDTNGTYETTFTVPKYSEPGERLLRIYLNTQSGNNTWSAEGNDMLEDYQLIPNSVAAGKLTITNSGSVDLTGPTLVGPITGIPASANVTGGDINFTASITVTDDISGVRGGRVYASINNYYYNLGTIDELTPNTVNGQNTTFQVPLTAYHTIPSGSYFIVVELDDKVGNSRSYSDDPASSSQSLPIPPTTSQLKLTITSGTASTSPDIAVEQPRGTYLQDNVGNFSFGTIERGEQRSRVFRITNTGESDLKISSITVAGTNPGDFIVSELDDLDVYANPYDYTEFTVTFKPTATGNRTAIVRVNSNDPDENPFDIVISGTAPTTPEIAVEHPANSGLSAGVSTVSYGDVPTNAPVTKTFTLKNLGSSALLISGTSLMGANAADFTITTAPAASVATNGSTTLTVRFGPLTDGAKTAFLRIQSNDPNESPFDIELTGTGTPSPGSFAFSAPLYEATEGAAATVRINRLGGTFGTASVRIATTNGTAVAPGDFAAISPSQEVTFDDGDSFKEVTINTVNNTSPVEPNETFTVALSSPTAGATLGGATSAAVRILDSGADAAIPVVTITAPLANANALETAGLTVNVTGTATDDKGVDKVQVSLNGGAFTDAVIPAYLLKSPSVTYSAPVTPLPGINTIAVKSIDTATKESTVVSRSFTFVVMRNLTVNVLPVGSGTVSFTPTSSRQLGTSYTILATPGTGKVFAGWTTGPGGPSLTDIGVTGTASEVTSLKFNMKEGLVLNANFISNPFTAVAGNYNGLVRHSATLPAPNGTNPSNSTEGFINVTLQPTGAFTAKLLIDGLTLNAGGVLDNSGTARFGTSRTTTVSVARPGKPSVALQFGVDLTPLPGGTGKLTGTVVQNYRTVITGVSEFAADLAISTGIDSNYLGTAGATATYTAFIQPQPIGSQPSGLTENDYPQGYSNAVITVSKTGIVTFTGNLADGTLNVTASSTLSKNSESAIFIQLYNKQGFLSALLELDYTNDDSDMSATNVLWARPYQDVQHYPFGWPEVIKLDLFGAKYIVPTVAENRSVVRTPDGTVAPDDGDSLSDGLNVTNPSGNAKVDFFGPPFTTAELTKDVNINSSDLVTKVVTDANFTLSIVRASGKFSGGFQRPDLSKPTYQGIIYQKGSLAGGYGWFLTPAPTVKTYDGFSGPVELSGKP